MKSVDSSANSKSQASAYRACVAYGRVDYKSDSNKGLTEGRALRNDSDGYLDTSTYRYDPPPLGRRRICWFLAGIVVIPEGKYLPSSSAHFCSDDRLITFATSN